MSYRSLGERLFVLNLAAVLAAVATSAAAQGEKEPPPLWDVQVGASFVGTSGNSQTASTGADFSLHRHWPVWQITSTATAVETSDQGVEKAQRYLGDFRADRTITPVMAFSTGAREERDRFSGISFRSILDAGLTWALRPDTAPWSLSATTSMAWDHEDRLLGPNVNDPTALLQLLSRIRLGAAGDTTQRFTLYPDFSDTSAYRWEAEVAAQAALNGRLALKLGYLARYAHSPVPGFKTTDSTTTASVVVRWRSAEPAPH